LALVARTMKGSAHWLLAVSLLALSSSVSAQLRVSDSIVNMTAEQQRSTIELTNTGASSLTVQLELHRVIDPGTVIGGDEVTQAAIDAPVRLNESQLEIGPGQSRSVIVHQSPRSLEHDDVYRLHVKPAIPAHSNGMNIVLNYNLLLFVRPLNADSRVRLNRRHDELTLSNDGNSNAQLSSLLVCDESSNECQPLPTQRLYANQQWQVPVPSHFDVETTVIYGLHSFIEERRRTRFRAPTLTASQ